MTATQTAAVDPRFEARRAAVERSGRRRRRMQLVVAVALLVSVLAAYGTTRSALLNVDHVQVVGAPLTGAARTIEGSGIRRGSPMFDLDASVAQRQLERLPWVRSARVARSWPGTVRISIVERRPVGAVEATEGGWFLVDSAGRLLASVDAPPAGLLVIDGVVAGAQPGQTLVELAVGAMGLLQRLGPLSKERVQRVRFVADRELELLLSPSPFPQDTPEQRATEPLVVRFGTLDRAGEKLLDLETFLSQVDQLCVIRIDVKVAHSPTPLRDQTTIGCPQ